MQRSSGQSILEYIFAIAVLMLLVSGAVALALYNLAGRTRKDDRADKVQLVKQELAELEALRASDPARFWAKTDVEECGDQAFPGLICEISYLVHSDEECGYKRCMTAAVEVTERDGSGAVHGSRFFIAN